MGDINKAPAMGINQAAFLFAQADDIFHRTQRAIIITMLAERRERQDITNLIHRNRHADRANL
ncbi:hypothetical protein D3C75_1335930 [compost metagenome]